MIKNNLTIAWRSILKQKGYSFINVFGLAGGMACCIFLLLWVQDELSFDRFHKNAACIFRVEANGRNVGRTILVPHPVSHQPRAAEAG